MLPGSHVGFFAVVVLAIVSGALFQQPDDDRIIRNMVDQAIGRLNRGDVTVFEDFWDEGADYVGVDGTVISGRPQIQAFFRKLAASSATRSQQTISIERVRFITPELAIVDGSWTVTGARDSAGKEMAPIQGRGVEVVQKKGGRWWFVATREMVIFKGN